jgi:hypothetical protein
MKRALRILSATVLIGALALWLGTGGHHGWTRTSVPVRTLDAVTGIEGIDYRQRFVPGLDFLGVALLATGLLAGTSFLIRKPTTHPQ